MTSSILLNYFKTCKKTKVRNSRNQIDVKFCSTCRCFLFACWHDVSRAKFHGSNTNHQQHLAKELQENPLNRVHKKIYF